MSKQSDSSTMFTPSKDTKVEIKSSEEIAQIRRRLSLWGDNLEIDGLDITGVDGDNEDTHDTQMNLSDSVVDTYIGKSKQGYNPANPYKKKNQDSFVMEHHPQTKSFLFGVFDGHGVHGDEVSQFVAAKIPQILFNLPIFSTDVLSALSATIENVVKLLNETDIDIQLSGTTLCLTVIRGNHAYIANVGDSRMMGINAVDDNLVLKVLTTDHKPIIPTESARIEAAGGKIETTSYDDGFSVTRVWMQKVRAPGLAMSRSIGDKIAHTIGVIDEPDLQDLVLSKDMKYLLLSSDGLFEFVTDDRISKIVQDNDNLSTCIEELFNLASNTWLEIEGVIDDITIVLVKLSA